MVLSHFWYWKGVGWRLKNHHVWAILKENLKICNWKEIYVKRFVDVVIADYEYIKRSLWNYVWLSNYNFSLPISQLDLPSWKTISFFKVGWTFNYRLETVQGVCKKNCGHLDMRFKIYSGKLAKVLGVYLDKAWEKVSWRLEISPEFTKLWKIWAPEECLNQV